MAPPELFLVAGSSAASGEIGAAAAPPRTALATSWTSRPAWKRAVAVRVEVRRSYRTLHLADSTTIRRGDRIGVLHTQLRFMIATGAELEGAFKPSSLRNIAKTSPYIHAGHFASLQEVLEHYNRAPAAPVGDTELKPLNLSVTELAHLEAFLRGLSGPLKTRRSCGEQHGDNGHPANRCTDRTRLPMN